MKKVYFFVGMLLCSAGVWGQTNMYIQGVNTWNTTNTNWGSTTGSSGKIWKNDSIANLEFSPVLTLTGFNPFAYGINCTTTGSVTPSASERIYLAGTALPAIDVSAAQTLTLNNILAGGRGFTKTTAGNLVIGNGNNRFLNFANGITIAAGTIDFTNNATIAASALRCMPVTLGSNTLQYTGATNSNLSLGGINGSGTLNTGAATRSLNIFSVGSNSTDATITASGFNIRGANSSVQTLSGSTSGITGTYAINGVSTVDGLGGTTNTLVFNGGATNTFNAATNFLALRGGKLRIDNTTNNTLNRFHAANISNIIPILGGTLEVLGNAAGTTLNVGGSYTTTAKSTQFNAGQINMILNQPAGATAATELIFGNGPTGQALRDGTQMTINFASTGSGTLGTAGINPHITWVNGAFATTSATSPPLLANSATGNTVGWATVNGTDWATYGANGIIARAFDITTATNTGLQATASNQQTLFNPVANQILTAAVPAAIITIDPQAAGLSLTGVSATNTINAIAIMHRGTNSFTIDGATGLILNNAASASRYIYVMAPSAVLSTNSLLNSATNPINKSGDGVLALTGATNQIAFSGAANINILGGVLRVNANAIGGGPAIGGAFTKLNFYGGVLELDGGFTLIRAIDLAGAVGGGGIGFDGGATARGNGGFSAINGNSSVSFVTLIGGAILAPLVWNDGLWLADGYSLLFGSRFADSRMTINNDIGLDNGAVTNAYFARQIYVYDNTGPATDEGDLSGIISGGPNADLFKGGPGTLRLSNTANTYSGNTIVAQGTLVAVGTGSLPAATSVLVKTGATLQLLANNTITDLVLESGSTLALGTNTLTLTGNFTNNGGTVSGTGTIVFNGTSQQYIDGVATTLYNLTMNNSAGMQILTAVTVNNALTLTSGIINTTATNLLTVAASGSTSGASNNSFVDGPIAKIGNSAFIFPVGKPNCGPSATVKGYAALTISAPGSATDQFTAEYKRGDALALGSPTMPVGLDHISRCDYWTLTRDNGTSTVDITLSWNEPINNCSSAAPYVNNIPSLTVAHFNGTIWDTYAVIGTNSGTNASGTVTWSVPQSTSFGTFTIGSVDFLNPLPITINYFTGIKQNGNHLLNWKVTCNTTPHATIVMERSSDGRNFNSIYSVYATALRCQQPFNYTDNQPAPGVNYYRLKMTDADGKISYSSIVSLINAVKGIDILNIAPNPIVNSRFNLNVSAAQKTQMQIVITDMQGRLMQKQNVNLIAGFNTIPMNVSNFSAGTYQVYGITAGERSKVMRFVVQ